MAAQRWERILTTLARREMLTPALSLSDFVYGLAKSQQLKNRPLHRHFGDRLLPKQSELVLHLIRYKFTELEVCKDLHYLYQPEIRHREHPTSVAHRISARLSGGGMAPTLYLHHRLKRQLKPRTFQRTCSVEGIGDLEYSVPKLKSVGYLATCKAFRRSAGHLARGELTNEKPAGDVCNVHRPGLFLDVFQHIA